MPAAVVPGVKSPVTIKVRCIGSMGPSNASPNLPEGSYYLKMCICSRTAKGVEPVEGVPSLKTPAAEGPKPIFETGQRLDYAFTMDIDTQYISIEMKQVKSLGRNHVVGTALLNPNFLAQLKEKPSSEMWIPLRIGNSKTPVTALARIVMAIPQFNGGQEPAPEAVKVVGASMRNRKLEVTVYNASVPKPHAAFVMGTEQLSDKKESAAPGMYVTIHTVGTDAEDKHSTKTLNSYFPEWNETFELFAEVTRSKALLLKLKQVDSPISPAKVIGHLLIPLGFYLSSNAGANGDKTEVWNTYTLTHPETNQPIDVRMEVRMTVEARAEDEKASHFYRTESKEPVKPSLSRPMSRIHSHSELADLGAVRVTEDDPYDDD